MAQATKKWTSSPAISSFMEEAGLVSVSSILEYLPRKYESFLLTDVQELTHLQDKQKVVLYGKVLARPRIRKYGSTSLVRLYFRNEANQQDFVIEAWNRLYLAKTIDLSSYYTIKGSFDAKEHCLNFLAMKEGKVEVADAIIPQYSLSEDVSQYAWRNVLKKVMWSVSSLPNIVPSFLRNRYHLLERLEAFRYVHFPTSPEQVKKGLRTLKYEEALLFSLKNFLIRSENKSLSSPRKEKIDFRVVGDFVRALPYPLTGDQKKAVRASLTDMNSETLMYRLLQGDVGTGKTLVAEILLYGNYCRGMQGALLAPTDALARQHYANLSEAYARYSIKTALLVGSLSPKEKKEILEGLKEGTIDIAIGTHALFSEGVEYDRLGLVIVDEQHKFGVNQRAKLASKGDSADMLLMSATPIPRTLAFSLYGDLDVSILSEFPAAKRDVQTKIVKPTAKEIIKSITASISSGHRVYICAPQIEKGGEDDTSATAVYEHYSSLYPGLVTLMHGKMKPEEKEEAIASFASGNTPILISTSVIEVGIDVREANLMIIYGPTHFGLASLHQLRGRIGRGGDESKCLLVYGREVQEELDRLRVLVQSNDGFEIAEKDLQTRGPGDVAGIRQSGLPDFRYLSLVTDVRMLECARKDAEEVYENKSDEDCRSLIEFATKFLEGSSLA
ncbi:MAG: ATP-dependent DNA helicase RecG [Candidatus Enteromonas sp.]|nr:ATP-dependent DNA helicase RecG [Candidatus Enteromonas sp.]MDY6093847.1 ATP-dependent DNA helicase RecG [Candidatus Enteromonas sp.]